MKKVIAIIPARGGSKRIPRKNIRNFLGKPIIEYSIETALKSKLFEEVMVSTDDREIALVAEAAGAKIPFFRSEEASGDMAQIPDVMEEVLLQYKKQGRKFDYACCIYSTAPFVKIENLKKALKIIEKTDADSVLPAARFSYPIQRALKIDEDDKLKMMWPENALVRSQDLEPAYHDAGQFFFLNTARFLKNKKIFTENTRYILIPASLVQDIDEEEDWKIAEMKYKLLK